MPKVGGTTNGRLATPGVGQANADATSGGVK